MQSFDDFKISKQLGYAIDDLGFTTPTPIQSQAFPVIASGKNVVGIAQTGTGKTLAYMLPILQQLKFSQEKHPRVLILVPTRELVVQVVGEINKFGKYLNHRVIEIYGGTNINTQKAMLDQGYDIVVATPGRLYDLEEAHGEDMCIIHSNKTQNYRLRSMKQFDQGVNRIMVTTDVMARGLDLNEITHVINFDTPKFPENYMHRIGRTGRAEKKGESILFYTKNEMEFKNGLESLMKMEIDEIDFPDGVEISKRLIPSEQPKTDEPKNQQKKRDENLGSGIHEKSKKNQKTNKGGSYQYKIAAKYKKPKTRGDKNYNKRNKKK
ncbi:UNVERIFIED_CONTAM: hypothetical protein GTU68_001308 [Idotea baltica]|nr:hypothetical protein [Idotea baltica]